MHCPCVHLTPSLLCQDLCMTETQGNPVDMVFVNLLVRTTQHHRHATLSSPCLHEPLPLMKPDHDTAQSAVRNLNNVDVGGRPLRIDLADSDPFLEGKTTVRGELIDGGETRAQWRERERDGFREPRDKERDKDAFLRTLPPGMPLPPGAQVLDMISRTLATMNPGQLVEVLAQMKVSTLFRSFRPIWCGLR